MKTAVSRSSCYYLTSNRTVGGFNFWRIGIVPIERLRFLAGVWCVMSREAGEPLEPGAKSTPPSVRARYVAIAAVVTAICFWPGTHFRFLEYVIGALASFCIFVTAALILLLSVVLLIACLRPLVQQLPAPIWTGACASSCS